MFPLPVRFEIVGKLLRSIDARREATGDQAIGSAVERDIPDRELAELTLEWMMKSAVALGRTPVTNTLTSAGNAPV